MNRRRFVGNAAIGSAVLVSGPAGCNAPSGPPKAGEASARTDEWAREFELDEANIAGLQDGDRQLFGRNCRGPDGGAKAITQRNAVGETLRNMLRQLAHHVEVNCNADM